MLDNGLMEAYLNGRSVMSVWVTHCSGHTTLTVRLQVTELMNETAVGHLPADRTASALPPPHGVQCSFESYELTPLAPIPA